MTNKISAFVKLHMNESLDLFTFKKKLIISEIIIIIRFYTNL